MDEAEQADPALELVFQSRGNPLDERQLRNFESGHRLHLPADYRRFLLTADGARFRLRNEIPDSWFDGFRELFSLSDRAAADRNLTEVSGQYAGSVPREFLAIGDDAAGGLICLGIDDPFTGEIYFWDHERESAAGDSPSMENMTRLAPSFSAFLYEIRLF